MDRVEGIMFYERRCAFCHRWVKRWKARTGSRILYVPREIFLPAQLFGRDAVQLIERNGKRSRGADAVFRALGRAPGLWLLTRFGRLPGVRHIAEFAYRRVARHRAAASAIDRALFGRATRPPRHAAIRSLFLRALGSVHLMAFSSLAAQVRGLYGERGILPIRQVLDGARTLEPKERLQIYPTLFWWIDPSDRNLLRVCRAGQLLAVALMLGIAPRYTLAALWALYVSFDSTGREFLSFQWDALLLESSLHAMVVAPGGLRLRSDRDPPWHSVLLMRWFAFRFFFEGGIAKLRSGDETWRSCTACSYHYQTQPLPTPLAYYANRLPPSLQRASTAAALAIECGAPFLAFTPRRVRRLGFGLQAGLQVLIAATGNYGFFNALSIALALWYIDDDVLPRALVTERVERTRAPTRWLMAAGAAVLFGATATMHFLRWDGRRPPKFLLRLAMLGQQLRSINVYGLFANMTTTRPELVIEGSDDGRVFHEYELRYKPGDIWRRPKWVAPHMPRLDWQLWFAALGRPTHWFVRFMQRLLEGSEEVLDLIGSSPFGDRPPQYVRATLYEYRMTDLATRKRTGAYWERTRLAEYLPPVTLVDGRLAVARPLA